MLESSGVESLLETGPTSWSAVCPRFIRGDLGALLLPWLDKESGALCLQEPYSSKGCPGIYVKRTETRASNKYIIYVCLVRATHPPEELPDVFRMATKVARNKTKHDEVWIAHFAKGLPAATNLPGLNQPVKAGSHILVYKASVHGHGRAEVLAKRHLARQRGEEAASSSTTLTTAAAAAAATAATAAEPEQLPTLDTEGCPCVILVDCLRRNIGVKGGPDCREDRSGGAPLHRNP